MAPQNRKNRIPFILQNVNICMCLLCPVQTRSQCVADKKSRMTEVLKSKTPHSDGIPALYCANGMASCPDLDSNQLCICENCPVFIEYRLAQGEPQLYFCRNGASR